MKSRSDSTNHCSKNFPTACRRIPITSSSLDDSNADLMAIRQCQRQHWHSNRQAFLSAGFFFESPAKLTSFVAQDSEPPDRCSNTPGCADDCHLPTCRPGFSVESAPQSSARVAQSRHAEAASRQPPTASGWLEPWSFNSPSWPRNDYPKPARLLQKVEPPISQQLVPHTRAQVAKGN